LRQQRANIRLEGIRQHAIGAEHIMFGLPLGQRGAIHDQGLGVS
jgi:hypothetical protein